MGSIFSLRLNGQVNEDTCKLNQQLAFCFAWVGCCSGSAYVYWTCVLLPSAAWRSRSQFDLLDVDLDDPICARNLTPGQCYYRRGQNHYQENTQTITQSKLINWSKCLFDTTDEPHSSIIALAEFWTSATCPPFLELMDQLFCMWKYFWSTKKTKKWLLINGTFA